MVSILDITPANVKAITVPVRGKDVEVRGVSLGDIAYLIQHYPEVKDLFAGKDVTFTVDTLLQRGPELVCGVLACGLGVSGNEKGMAIIRDLSLEEQADLLDAILKETFKGGLGPFVEKVTAMFGVASDLGTKARASSGQKQPKP